MSEENKRASRASQTREKKEKVWTPSSLDAPPAPTGFSTDG